MQLFQIRNDENSLYFFTNIKNADECLEFLGRHPEYIYPENPSNLFVKEIIVNVSENFKDWYDEFVVKRHLNLNEKVNESDFRILKVRSFPKKFHLYNWDEGDLKIMLSQLKSGDIITYSMGLSTEKEIAKKFIERYVLVQYCEQNSIEFEEYGAFTFKVISILPQ